MVVIISGERDLEEERITNMAMKLQSKKLSDVRRDQMIKSEKQLRSVMAVSITGLSVQSSICLYGQR